MFVQTQPKVMNIRLFNCGLACKFITDDLVYLQERSFISETAMKFEVQNLDILVSRVTWNHLILNMH